MFSNLECISEAGDARSDDDKVILAKRWCWWAINSWIKAAGSWRAQGGGDGVGCVLGKTAACIDCGA
jgi:hypothetical protein